MTRFIRVLPWILFALVPILWAPGAIYDPLSDEVIKASDRVWVASFLAFPIVGVFLARRFSGNAVGWLFIVGPALAGAGISAGEYGQAVGSSLVEAIGGILYLLGILVLFASFLLFPDGKYPSRLFVIIHVTLLALLAITGLFLGDHPAIGFLVLLNLLLPVVALGYRAAKGDATTRRQIAAPILVIMLGLVFGTVVTLLVPSEQDVNGWSGVASFVIFSIGIPASIAVSITKYRLYEIDRLVSRTVSYAIVVGLMAGLFLILVAGVTAVLNVQNDLVIAASTLAVAGLFNPLRRRVQREVDRRFNRSKYDTQRVMEEFAGSLRDETPPEDLLEGWVGVVSTTMQPSSLGIWARNGSGTAAG